MVVTTHESWRFTSVLGVLLGLIALCAGLVLSYLGYLWGTAYVNPGELLGSFLFWLAAVSLVFMLPLRSVIQDFARSIRTRLGAGVFAGYLAIHLILYGFLLEVILTLVYGSSLLGVSSPSLFISTDVFLPPSLINALLDISYNPSIIFTDPPVFSAALSFYSISMALLIAVLVLANIVRTRELGRLCTARKKARSFVLVPAIGVILGASCCLSVAGLVSLLPSLALANELSSLSVYYLTYFFLPAFAVVILYVNLHSIRRISASIASSTP